MTEKLVRYISLKRMIKELEAEAKLIADEIKAELQSGKSVATKTHVAKLRIQRRMSIDVQKFRSRYQDVFPLVASVDVNKVRKLQKDGFLPSELPEDMVTFKESTSLIIEEVKDEPGGSDRA